MLEYRSQDRGPIQLDTIGTREIANSIALAVEFENRMLR